MVKRLRRLTIDCPHTPNPNADTIGLSVRRNPELFQPPINQQLKTTVRYSQHPKYQIIPSFQLIPSSKCQSTGGQ